MSPTNIEIVTLVNAAMNRGDVDAAMEFFAPDAELRDLANGPDQAGVVRGVDALRATWTLWTDAFDEMRADVEEWSEAGNAVVGLTRWQGRGKASGMSIDVRQWDVYELREGKIIRATLGLESKAEAIQAVGGHD